MSIASSLARLHNASGYHGNLKPSNILFDETSDSALLSDLSASSAGVIPIVEKDFDELLRLSTKRMLARYFRHFASGVYGKEDKINNRVLKKPFKRIFEEI